MIEILKSISKTEQKLNAQYGTCKHAVGITEIAGYGVISLLVKNY